MTATSLHPGVILGTITRLQLQSASLKIGQKPNQRYDPGPLRSVDALLYDGRGLRLVTAEPDQPELMDIHHPDHPQSRYRDDNPLSIGFTSHYRLMRDRFGEHLSDGIAGENLLITCDRLIEESDLTRGLLVSTTDGAWCLLTDLIAAPPCVEFARFALQFPDDQRPDRRVTDAVRFLSNGVRGFYGRFERAPVQITTGAQVAILD